MKISKEEEVYLSFCDLLSCKDSFVYFWFRGQDSKDNCCYRNTKQEESWDNNISSVRDLFSKDRQNNWNDNGIYAEKNVGFGDGAIIATNSTVTKDVERRWQPGKTDQEKVFRWQDSITDRINMVGLAGETRSQEIFIGLPVTIQAI